MEESRDFVPYTLAGNRYALRLESVRQVVRAAAVTQLPGAPPLVHGIIDVRGDIMPVISVRRRFGLPEKEIDPSDHFIIAHTGRRLVALVVDDAGSVFSANPGNLTAADIFIASSFSGEQDFRGALKTPDGMILIHDLGLFLSLDDEAAIDRAASAGSAVPECPP